MNIMPKREVELTIFTPEKIYNLLFGLQKFVNSNELQEIQQINTGKNHFVIDSNKNKLLIDLVGPYTNSPEIEILKTNALEANKINFRIILGKLFSLTGDFFITKFLITPNENSQLMSCVLTLQNAGEFQYFTGGKND